MCLNWLKNIFSSLTEEEQEPDEPAVVEENDDYDYYEPEDGDEPVVEYPEQKPYEGCDFHVLLDNGHASSTPGKRMQLENGGYFYEYEFNRDVVRRIASKLYDLGIPFEVLVPELDTDVALSTRAARANSFCSKYGKDRCLFISVHSNAFGNGLSFTSAKGWSVWTTKGPTKSDEYATIFFEEAEKLLPKFGFTTRKDVSDGDPDYEENFTVIYKTWCPAVLTENLFFTNREEVRWLMTSEGRDAIAEIHVNAIERIIKEAK